ncbi:MAG: endopeptidase La, partial [Clostridia bacterium]|nr:endopeptidase La [Clostridia bacterium]
MSKNIPMVALRDVIVFPHMALHFEVGRDKSVAAVEKAMENDQIIFLAAQKDRDTEDPKPDEIYEIGTVSRIKQILKLPGNVIRVLVKGVYRARIDGYLDTQEHLSVVVSELVFDEVSTDKVKESALKRMVMDTFEQLADISPKVSSETMASVNSVDDIGQMADIIASSVLFKLEDKQTVLECIDTSKRLDMLIEMLTSELDIAVIENEIRGKVRKQIDKSQREYVLREQMRAIKSELGEEGGVLSDADELRE